MTANIVEVPARAHLAGNPSDGYGGAVVSTTVPGLAATVTATPDDVFAISGPGESWSSMDDLASTTRRLGYDGGDRLVRAALVTLDRHLGPGVERRPGRFEWSTTIPRSVGLGGSSALVVATMRAALALWEAEAPTTAIGLAELALAAETHELAIAAGLADRAVQVIGGVVLTDCRSGPTATPVDVAHDPGLTLLWNEDAAAPSGDYHADLRRAFSVGDAATVAGVGHLAALADRAADAIERGDTSELAAALDGSLETRCQLGSVPAAALDGVDELRMSGAAVNFAGSGGALVVLGPCAAPDGWSSSALPLTGV
ncbi:GHMP family kinase ATP-binding protein [Actinospongicola halichondriae]|uniref:GHMP family kinase ATP-binding protein n=1 Tax=Actinospongicola halichondriae TaxID=3236844 RepID=UPI003D52C1BB